MPSRSNRTEAYHEAKARYYSQGADKQPNKKRPWLPLEEQQLLNKPANVSDVELAAQLGRPVMGIQVKRSKLLAAQKKKA